MTSPQSKINMAVTLQAADVQSVAEWLRCDPSEVSISPCWMPIHQHRDAVENMLASYEYLPKERERTNRILDLLLDSGEPLQPVFIAAGDAERFVMEGRHRLVAFWEAGLRYIPVALVTKVTPEHGTTNPAPTSVMWPTPPIVVDAHLRSDDGERITRVDLTEWFLTASDKELFSLERKGWRPYSALEKIAHKLAETSTFMAEQLEYIAGRDEDDFKVMIFSEDAARFCQDRRSRRSAEAAGGALSEVSTELPAASAPKARRAAGLSL
jgi:hypothetical protein